MAGLSCWHTTPWVQSFPSLGGAAEAAPATPPPRGRDTSASRAAVAAYAGSSRLSGGRTGRRAFSSKHVRVLRVVGGVGVLRHRPELQRAVEEVLQRRRPEGDEPVPHDHEPAVALRQEGAPGSSGARFALRSASPHQGRRSGPTARHRRICSDDVPQSPRATHLQTAGPCSSPLRGRHHKPPRATSSLGQGDKVGGRTRPAKPRPGGPLECTAMPMTGSQSASHRRWFSRPRSHAGVSPFHARSTSRNLRQPRWVARPPGTVRAGSASGARRGGGAPTRLAAERVEASRLRRTMQAVVEPGSLVATCPASRAPCTAPHPAPQPAPHPAPQPQQPSADVAMRPQNKFPLPLPGLPPAVAITVVFALVVAYQLQIGVVLPESLGTARSHPNSAPSASPARRYSREETLVPRAHRPSSGNADSAPPPPPPPPTKGVVPSRVSCREAFSATRLRCRCPRLHRGP